MADQSQSVAKVVEVQASWDPEAKVWVATCSEIEGLVTEAPTKERVGAEAAGHDPRAFRAGRRVRVGSSGSAVCS